MPKLSLLKTLKESVGENNPPTLTDNEVFIVDYLNTEIDPSLLYRIETGFENYSPNEMYKIKDIFKDILTYLSLKNLSKDYRLIQYVICAIENQGKEITTNTPIKRLKTFDFTIWGTEKQIVYNKYSIENLPVYNDDDISDLTNKITDRFWDWSPDSSDSDYGDSDFLGFDDPETYDSKGYLII
jgi:hypothetical protein